MRCVACQICEKECPPKCIFIEKSKDKKPDYLGKPQFYPAVFNIDVSVCMSCQICVEVCPFDAIEMDTAFELSTDDRFGGLLWHKEQLAKSNEYFHKIHPVGKQLKSMNGSLPLRPKRRPRRSPPRMRSRLLSTDILNLILHTSDKLISQ